MLNAPVKSGFGVVAPLRYGTLPDPVFTRVKSILAPNNIKIKLKKDLVWIQENFQIPPPAP